MPRPRTYFLIVSKAEPRGRRFVRLDAPSVLAWFQRNWTLGRGGFVEELRGEVYGLDQLFEDVEIEKIAAPKTDEELVPLLEKHIYFEGDIEAEPHFVHVETDDDEVEIAYFFFDDTFLDDPDCLDRLPNPGRRRTDRYAKFVDARLKRDD